MCVLLSVLVRPWLLGPVGSPPLSSTVNFASIVEEEKQQQAALIRSREKPLALIQVTCHVCARCAFFYTCTQTTEAVLDFNTRPPINPSGRLPCLLKMGWFHCCCNSSYLLKTLPLPGNIFLSPPPLTVLMSFSQIEERAIQDLLLHYNAHENPDELISVERSSGGPVATPTWKKH